jgi:hypothetical protein
MARTVVYKQVVMVNRRPGNVVIFDDGSSTCSCAPGALYGNGVTCAHVQQVLRTSPQLARKITVPSAVQEQVELGVPAPVENPVIWEGTVSGKNVVVSGDGIITCACGGVGSTYRPELDPSKYPTRCDHIKMTLGMKDPRVVRALEGRMQAIRATKLSQEEERQASKRAEIERALGLQGTQLAAEMTTARPFGADFGYSRTSTFSPGMVMSMPGPSLPPPPPLPVDPATVPINELELNDEGAQKYLVRECLEREILKAMQGSRYSRCTVADINLGGALETLGGYSSLVASSEQEIARAVGLTRWAKLLWPPVLEFQDRENVSAKLAEKIAVNALRGILEDAAGIPITDPMIERARERLPEALVTFSPRTLAEAVGQIELAAIIEPPAREPSPYDGVALRHDELLIGPGRPSSALARLIENNR